MNKTVFILPLLFLLITPLWAQKGKVAFEMNSFYVYINSFTPDAIDAINSREDKRKLTYILARDASQSDLEELCRQLRWIRKLDISMLNHQIYDIAAVSQLDSLTEFKANFRKSSREIPLDLQALSKLTALTKLELKSTYIINSNALRNLKKLQSINFENSNVEVISFLCGTPNLRFVNLSGSEHTFENYELIACLRELRELKINANRQATDERLKVLKDLPKLSRISMKDIDSVTSLNFLKENPNILGIIVKGCSNLLDFSALANIRKLSYLDFGGTQLENLNILEGITKIIHIDMSGTNIEDISFLKECEGLLAVDVSGTLVKDISPLYNCNRLISVKLNSAIPNFDEAIAKLRAANPDVKVTKS